jgi:Raf kinase inhibitor-like YbhB/YbcL family protein
VLRRARLLPLLPLAVVLGACSDDGRRLAPPRPGQTTAPAATASATGAAEAGFTLSSEAFADGGPLPERFTCEGAGVSPPLSWSDPPAPVELAVVVRDRDRDGYVQWIVTGIDPVVTGFGEGGVPEGAAEQANGEGATAWLPPCPPPGDERHVYELVLHALDAPVEVDPALPAADVAALIEAEAVESARLTATDSPGAG